IQVPPSFGSSARVSHLRVDESHGDAYAVWSSQGMPESPSAEQRAALLQAMEPAPLVPDTTVAVADGTVTIDFELPRFGVSLVTLTPAGGDAGETGGSAGVRSVPAREREDGCACRYGVRGDTSHDSFAFSAFVGLLLCVRRRRTTARP